MKQKARGKAKAKGQGEAGPKERTTLYLRRDLFEEARSAVFLADLPSLSDLMDAALERELERLRKAHNRGRPFPRRSRGLPGGRPRRRGNKRSGAARR